jgi:hypothetical protein
MRIGSAIVVACVAACASSTPQPNATPPPSPSPTPTATATATSTGAPLPDLLMPSEPTSGGTTTATTTMPNAKPPPKEEQPGCATDQDCWSITCCPATSADECVHHSLAQECAIVDVTCPKLDAHLDCACEKGVCTGRAP